MRDFLGVAPFLVFHTALALLALAGSCAPARIPPAAGELQALSREYVELQLELNPSLATELGAHEHDARLADLSEAGVAQAARRLEELSARLQRVEPADLDDPAERIEHALLEARLKADILERREIRSHARNPMLYPLEISFGLLSLAGRPYAPAGERMLSAAGRLRAVDGLLAAARANLRHPPELFTRAALDVARACTELIASDYSEAFGTTADLNLKLDFETARGEAAEAMRRFLAWLEEDLLPRSSGDFGLGERLLTLKLESEEMLDIPLIRLLEIGERQLERESAGLARLSEEILPGVHPRRVMEDLARERPGGGSLVAAVGFAVEEARRFVEEKRPLSLPPAPPPRVQEAPRVLRFTLIALAPAGALEGAGAESYYYVALPDPAWPAGRVGRYLEEFGRPALALMALRDTYPGRYVQAVARRQSSSRLRRVVPAGSYTEGWAHYGEQMMIEEGFGAADPRLRWVQARESVLRLCRLVAAVKLHTHRMTLAEATRLFAERVFLDPRAALHEAERGAYDPSCLSAALGKLQILKLREDLRARQGERFLLREFHDRVLAEGKLPIPLLRRVLMPDDDRPSL